MMERPPLTFQAGVHASRWTYGLQLDLQRMVPDAESAVTTIMDDPYVRDYLIRRAITPIKKSVTDNDQLIDAGDIELDPDQTLELLDWIAGHLLYFFVKSVGNLTKQGMTMRESLPTIPQPEPSVSGSENSAS